MRISGGRNFPGRGNKKIKALSCHMTDIAEEEEQDQYS